MNDTALQKQIDQIERELRLSGEALDSRNLEVRADIDRIKLEIAALKKFLKTALPDFEERYREIFSRTVEEVDPESE